MRELQNAMERAVIRSRSGPLEFDLPAAPVEATAPAVDTERPILTQAQWEDLERQNIEAALKETGWRVSGPKGAAGLLRMKPTTLASKIRGLGIERYR